MYVIDFIPKAFQPFKQNTANKKWETYTPKVFPNNTEPFLQYHFFIPQFTLFCVAWKLGEHCNVLLTYCNHIVLKILWVTKGRVDKSILAGKPSVQPYTFFFKMLIGQREQINVQKGRGFVFFKVGLWLSVSTDSFTYLKIFI